MNWKNKNIIISSLKKRDAVIIIKQSNDNTQDEIFEHLKEKIIERFNQ
jgi:Mg/Co/Ni transporter MgtE